MTAKLKHIALVSDNYATQGKFYEAAFGMRTAADPRPERAVTVSDGYVGLNINPRKPGRPAGLDHFGFEVDDAREVCARLERHGGVRSPCWSISGGPRSTPTIVWPICRWRRSRWSRFAAPWPPTRALS